MRILMWDVHGGYTDTLTAAPHDFVFLRDPSPQIPDGLGTAGLRRLPNRSPRLREVSLSELRDDPPDIVVAQRMEEVAALADLLRRRPGHELGAVYLEHNTPRGDVPCTRHRLADDRDWLIVHVTHFNALFWDCGSARTRVIEHGLPDPGHRFSGHLDHLAFVVNEPVRRWRVTGTDLLACFADHPVDAFGIDGQLLPPVVGHRVPQLDFCGNLGHEELLGELAARRAYLHLTRWTSLGLTVIESMMLGLPVVVLETTEAARAVPRSAGARSTDLTELVSAAGRLRRDLELATDCGLRARHHALDRFAHGRFLAEWDDCWQTAAR